MPTLRFQCNGCVTKCKHSINGTLDEHLERYLICPDITMHEKKYRDPIMKKDPSGCEIIPEKCFVAM